MPVFEQDWLELGSRVAKSLHDQHPRNLRLLQAAQAERRSGPSPGTTNAPWPTPRQRSHDP